MKRVLMVGNVACGKTTLCQRLNHQTLEYRKTQTLEVISDTIDTPGEYMEHRALIRALVVTAAEADLVLFLQDATAERFLFSPGAAGMFPIPAAGVVSKIDAATERQRKDARELLEIAGASPIFEVSAKTGEGIDRLIAFLEET